MLAGRPSASHCDNVLRPGCCSSQPFAFQEKAFLVTCRRRLLVDALAAVHRDDRVFRRQGDRETEFTRVR